MADNVIVDNGDNTDYTVSSDEAASGQVQRVKLTYSADGSDTHVGADADGLLVNLGANNDVIVSDGGNSITVDDGSSSLTVDDGGDSLTVDGTVGVSGTVTVDSELTTGDLDTGAGTDTRAVVGLVGSASGGGAIIPGNATSGLKVDLGADNDVTVTGTVAVTQSGTWDEVGINDSGNSITVDAPVGTPAFVRLSDGSSAITTLPVSIAATVTTKETKAATATLTQVSDTASSTTVLASNSNRLGASIMNDSSARLYLKMGTTASTTSYTVSLAQYDYWEVPSGYTGGIDGIWATDPGDGAARVTEYTA